MDTELFAVAAQVIPVLLLVLLVEGGGDIRLPLETSRRHRTRGDAFAALLVVVIAVYGEVAAITALAGRPTRLERQVVLTALALLGFLLVVPVAVRQTDVIGRGRRPAWRLAISVAVAALVTAPLVAVVLTVLV